MKHPNEAAQHGKELDGDAERLLSALISARSVAWTLDFAAGRLALSHNAAELLGTTSDPSVEELVALVHAEDQAALRASFEALEEGRSPADLQFRLPRARSGELACFEARARPLRDSSGRVSAATGLFVDVTERRRADDLRTQAAALDLRNRHIQEANRVRNELLSTMSHDLRTPLNAIIGFAELLYDEQVEQGSAEQKEFLNDILTSGQNLLTIINDILELARVEAGKMQLYPEPVDLAALVQQVRTALGSIATQKSIAVETDLDASLVDISIDPARFCQILHNYLSNALKFTPDGGRVVVRTRPEGADAFRVEVEDNGAGIAPANMARLFVELEPPEGGTSKRLANTGLGLALTQRLAEAQGGSVGLRSALGNGSTFYAVLPRRQSRQRSERPAVSE